MSDKAVYFSKVSDVLRKDNYTGMITSSIVDACYELNQSERREVLAVLRSAAEWISETERLTTGKDLYEQIQKQIKRLEAK